jgi:hypothetical protein
MPWVHSIRSPAGSLLVVLLLGGAEPLGAQADTAGVGARVRLTPRQGPPVTGTVVCWQPDSVVLMARSGEVAFASASVRRIEIHAGRRRDTWTGASIGAATGGALGLLLGYATADPDEGDFENLETMGRMYTGSGIGLAVGGVIGAIAGSLHQGDRWRPVPMPGPRVVALPGGRAGAGLEFRF